jgi:predicted PhzF superfamily epimerase YddE/YHI9
MGGYGNGGACLRAFVSQMRISAEKSRSESMKIPIYQVDAFTNDLFGGNPAAVCPLEEWPDDVLLQKIAMENNLSETAFFVKRGSNYHIRWMTPMSEVDLCGHATLASAFIIFNFIDKDTERILFDSRSGELVVTRSADLLSLDFPARVPFPAAAPPTLLEAFPDVPVEILFNKTYLLAFDSEKIVREMAPDFRKLLDVDTHGAIITAPGDAVDFVSRFFAPDVGVNEDPVTGYAHTLLVPYWAHKLGKKCLHALQVSPRGGELFCEHLGERVKISGHAVLFFEGTMNL